MQSLLIASDFRGQKFDRNQPIELRIPRQIDLAHSALANL
jgi:hypothetical protein